MGKLMESELVKLNRLVDKYPHHTLMLLLTKLLQLSKELNREKKRSRG